MQPRLLSICDVVILVMDRTKNKEAAGETRFGDLLD